MTAISTLISAGGGGGGTLPIGAGITLLNTETLVTQGSEVFLRGGTTSDAATYPNAPTGDYINATSEANGSNIATPYISSLAALSNWGGRVTVGGGRNSVTQRASDGRIYKIDAGYLYAFNHDGSGVTTQHGTPAGVYHYSTTGISTDGCGGFQHIDGSGQHSGELMMFNSSTLTMYFYNADTLAYISHFTLSGLSTEPDKRSSSWVYIATTASSQDNYFTFCIRDPGYYMSMHKFSRTTGAHYSTQVPLGTNDTTIRGRIDHMLGNNFTQGIPYTNGYGSPIMGIYCRGASGSGTPRISYFSISNGNWHSDVLLHGDATFGTWAGAFWSSTTSQLAFYEPGNQSTAAGGTGVTFGNYTASPGTAPIASLTLPTTTDTTTSYSGVAIDEAQTSRYWGDVTRQKALVVNLTTTDFGTPIDLSGQAAPYKFATDATHLYNMNGTNVHKYLISNQTFVSTIDLSAQISGTNAVDIAWDKSTYFYILDGSNSVVYKYDSSWTLVSTITLSGAPHASYTLKSIDILSNKLWVGMDGIVKLYNMDGSLRPIDFSTSAAQTGSYIKNNKWVAATGTSTQSSGYKVDLDVVGNPSGSQYWRVQ